MSWAITGSIVLNPTNGGSLQRVDDATLIMEDGKISAIGENLSPPEDCRVLDVDRQYVLPGLIDACTRLGLREESHGQPGWDDEENTNTMAPLLRAIDGVWPEDEGLSDALLSGITTAGVIPGGTSVIAGQGAILKTRGRDVDEMCLDNSWTLRVNLVKTGERTPAEAVRELRRTLLHAQHRLEHDNEGDLPACFEVYRRVLSGELPLMCRADDHRDILNILKLKDELGFGVILERLTEGYHATDDLQQEYGVIVGPLLVNRRGNTRNISLLTPGVLNDAGVKVALTTDHPTTHIDHLMTSAAVAHSEGLPEAAAIASVTRVPATLMGLQDRIGSLDVGSDADVAVFSGHPFRTASIVTNLFINGCPVPLPERRLPTC